MNFDSLADRLYSSAPGLFVTERNAAAKEARKSGDRELAAQIHRLTKPTTVGWLANQLVRQHPDEIRPLLELGADLREATASLSRDKLQELMRLQHLVIAGLIKQARIVARESEQRVSEDALRGLEVTLRAALADKDLGKQLLTGRLTGELEHVGFGGSETSTAVPRTTRKVVEEPVPDPRLAAAEQAVRDAEEEAQAAARAHEQARADLEETQEVTRRLSEKVQHLQAELDQAGAEKTNAERAEQAAQRSTERAERKGEQARQSLDAAKAARDELTS